MDMSFFLIETLYILIIYVHKTHHKTTYKISTWNITMIIYYHYISYLCLLLWMKLITLMFSLGRGSCKYHVIEKSWNHHCVIENRDEALVITTSVNKPIFLSRKINLGNFSNNCHYRITIQRTHTYTHIYIHMMTKDFFSY